MTAWLATIFQIIGVFCLSGRLTTPVIAFSVMTVGSIGWMIEGARRRIWSIVTLNAVFTISNIIGIVRWQG